MIHKNIAYSSSFLFAYRTDHPDGSKIIVHFEAMDVGPFSFGLDFTVGGPDPVTARDHGRVDIK